jgi:N,N'-diacetyllegionaminate synthase
MFSTPGDSTALRMLIELGMPAIKISSGLLTNLPLIKMAATGGRPLIISTGMARADEVSDAVQAARAGGCREIALLQCTSLYPAPPATLNLRAMTTLEQLGNCPVGYSDHHAGHLAVLAAVARGATIIEKHFTLNSSAAGADHAISIEPDEFRRMTASIRDIEAMLGSTEKAPVDLEAGLRDGRHRRLVSARDLPAGAAIGLDDIYLMRLPAGREALPASRLPDVVGKKARVAISRLSGLTAALVEGLE